MKKVLCLILAALMGLSLCACGNTEQTGNNENTPTLQIGFGRADITPTVSVPLGGYGSTQNRLSENILDNLYATCLAFTEGDQTLLLFSVDAIRSEESWTEFLRTTIQQKLGIPKTNVMVVSSHTHSAPDLASDLPSITQNYWNTYMDGMMAAAEAALADRTPGTLHGTSTEVEGMTFVRHYIMNDGSYAGPNYGNWSSGIKEHASENDQEMRLVKFDRVGDKQDILLMNWQAHPCITGGSDVKNVSADYIGTCRSKIEKDTGMGFVFIQGAAGNQATFSQISSENSEFTESNKGYGEALAQAAIDALPNLTKIEGSGIKVHQKKIPYNTNTEGIEKYAEAQEVVDLWNSSGSREIGNAKAREYGFSSVYEANAVLSKMGRLDKSFFILDVTYIGGIAFAHTPYEMFADQGRYIKENSPFDMTIVATMSNKAWGYFPTKEAFNYNNGSGCYESFGAYFAEGSAEDAAAKLVEMLNTLKG